MYIKNGIVRLTCTRTGERVDLTPTLALLNTAFGVTMNEEELKKIAALSIVGEGVLLANGELVAEKVS